MHDAGLRTVARAEHKVGAAMAVAVVAAGHGAEHRGGEPPGLGLAHHLLPAAGDEVPDDEAVTGLGILEEDAPVAAVEDDVAAVMGRRRPLVEGGSVRGGDDTGGGVVDGVRPCEEGEQRRGPVEAAVAAEEGGVGDDAAPGPADEGGADEERRIFRREAEEDLRDGVVYQLRRRRRHGVWGREVGEELKGRASGHIGPRGSWK